MMHRQVRFAFYDGLIAALDVLLVNAGFGAAFLLLWRHLAQASVNLSAYRHTILAISLTVPIVFHLLGLYEGWLRRSLRHVMYSVVVAIVVTCISTMALGFWSRQFAFPRSVIVLAAGVQIVMVSLFRFFARRLYRRRLGNRRTVVVGESRESAMAIARKFEQHSHGLYLVDRCFAISELKPPYEGLGSHETVVLTEKLDNKDDLVLHCFRQNKELLIVPSISELTVYGAEALQVDDLLVFGIQPHRLEPAEEILKRSIDLMGAAALLLVTSPVLVAVAIAIHLTSEGPILFRQERVGKDRRVFHLLKFRTMVHDAERYSGPVLAVEGDPRITALGRFLRATRLDEFPQLINILSGDMSLVGPRPEREFFVNQHEATFPAYELRHSVKPGATGLAQVMGRYDTTVERKLHFDLLYIYNYSLVLDLKILMQTVMVVLQSERTAGINLKKPLADRVSHVRKLDTLADLERAAE